MSSKASKRRRKRRLVHQGAVPTPEPVGGGEEASGEAESAPSEEKPTSRSAPRATSGPRRAERNADDERPPAPWGKFPLIELAILAGIVMLILGLFVVSGERGGILIAAGAVLASIGGLDTAIREHFAGYRSHTLLLAGVPAAIVLGVLFYKGPSDLSSGIRALIGLGVFAVAAVLLARLFRSRSGGRWFRLSGFRG